MARGYEFSIIHSGDIPIEAESTASIEMGPLEGANVQELPQIDGGWKAWTFCISSFILETVVWGFGFSFGIFQDYYTSHPPFNNSSPVAISAVGTITLAIMYCEALLLSLLFGRYPDWMKFAMWSGLGLGSTCLFVSSFANQVWQLILLQGVGLGVGSGALYMPVMMLLPEWFVRRRGLACGIIFAGSGVGGFMFPFLLNALLDRVGFRWTLRIWAIGVTIISSIALLGIRPRLPIPRYRSGQSRPRFIPPKMKFIKAPLFWSFVATNVLQALSFFPVALYIAPFTKVVSSPLSATVALALFNSSGVVGQILIGYLADRFPYPWIMFLSAVGSGLSAFLLWGFSSSIVQIFLFAIIFGGLSGGFSSVWPAASSDCAGNRPEDAEVVFGCTSFFKGIAAVIGPILSGALVSVDSSSMGHGYGRYGYGAVEVFVGACSMAAGVGSLVVAMTSSKP